MAEDNPAQEDGSPAEESSEGRIRPAVKKMARNHRYALFVLFAVIAMVILTALLWISFLPREPSGPGIWINTNKSSTANATIWTVTSISSGSSGILKSNIYVQIRNATGLVMTTTLLADATGHDGFTYSPANAGNYLSPGDVFSLSKDYATGCRLILVAANGQDQYLGLTV